MHGGQLEIKKLSLQLFHNSLDFRAGEQPRSLPFTESKKPTRYFSVSLPFNFLPYTVQSPDRGPVHPTDSVEIYMYVYTYIYPRARCNNAFDDLCGVSSPWHDSVLRFPLKNSRWRSAIREKKSHPPLIASIMNDSTTREKRKIFLWTCSLIIKKKKKVNLRSCISWT